MGDGWFVDRLIRLGVVGGGGIIDGLFEAGWSRQPHYESLHALYRVSVLLDTQYHCYIIIIGTDDYNSSQTPAS